MTPAADLLADLRLGHSEFQLDCFVLSAQGVTVWGAYQQCLRELRAREEALAASESEAERLTLRAARAAARAGRWWLRGRADARIDARDAARALAALRASYADRARERDHLLARADALRAELLRGGPLTPARVAALDAEHWYAAVRRRAAMEVAANDRLEGPTIALLAGLPPAPRARILAALTADFRGAFVAEAMNAAPPAGLLPPAAEGAPC